jgi:hypothetical protein
MKEFKKCNPIAHHSDYSKPLDIEWLCNSCHERLHAEKNDERFKHKEGVFSEIIILLLTYCNCGVDYQYRV